MLREGGQFILGFEALQLFSTMPATALLACLDEPAGRRWFGIEFDKSDEIVMHIRTPIACNGLPRYLES